MRLHPRHGPRPRRRARRLRRRRRPARRPARGRAADLRRAVPAVRHAAVRCIRTTSARYERPGRAAAGGDAGASACASAGCITLTDELAGMETVAAAAGRRRRPGDRADLAARRRRHQHGGRRPRPRLLRGARASGARSIGSAPLGRRIYIGPFATQGALDRRAALARRRRLRLALSGELLMRAPLPRRPSPLLSPPLRRRARRRRARDPATCLATLQPYDNAGLALSDNHFRSATAALGICSPRSSTGRCSCCASTAA